MTSSIITPSSREKTTRLSPARGLAWLLSFGRPGGVGPREVGSILDDRQLHHMFATVRGTYDAQNRILSLGRDAGWRRVLVDMVRAADGELVCDMATGTGDVSIAIARRYPGARVLGIDYCEPMLAVARRRLGALPADVRSRVELRQGDMRASDVGTSTVDVLTNTFALRNMPDRAPVLAEFHRVLKPGGRLYIMEPGIPAGAFMRVLYGLYFDHVLPLLGNVLSRTDYAYTYLHHSIERFPGSGEFLAELAAARFVQARAIPLTFGIAVLYRAIRGGGK